MASEPMSPTTSGLGKRVAFTSMSASAMHAVMSPLASSRSWMVNDRVNPSASACRRNTRWPME